jgi:hypothetical protein
VCGVACSVLSATSRPARAAQPAAPLVKHTYIYMWSFMAKNGARCPSLEAHGAQPRTTQWIGRSTRDSQHPIETRNVKRKMDKTLNPCGIRTAIGIAEVVRPSARPLLPGPA